MNEPADPQRLRILFALPFVPRADARHGGRATAGLVLRLAERHDLGIVCLRPPGERPLATELRARLAVAVEVPLQEHGRRLVDRARRGATLLRSLARARPVQVSDAWSAEYRARLVEAAERFDPHVVHVELHAGAQYAGALAGRGPALVLVAHEPATRTALEVARRATGGDRAVRWLDVLAWRRFERRALPLFDAVVALTESDRQALLAAAASTPVVTIPLHVPVPPQPLDPLGVDPPIVLFVGGFGHPPNVDAALRLAEQVMPRVWASRPEAVLQLVGDKPPPALRALAGTRVAVTGRVPDVCPYLDRTAVFAAPLRLGGGMRVKVLEALAAGKAVVASALAVAGLEVADGDQLLLAESDEELAASILLVLDDPETRAGLARRARSWAETALDPERSAAAFERLYRDLVRGRAA